MRCLQRDETHRIHRWKMQELTAVIHRHGIITKKMMDVNYDSWYKENEILPNTICKDTFLSKFAF